MTANDAVSRRLNAQPLPAAPNSYAAANPGFNTPGPASASMTQMDPALTGPARGPDLHPELSQFGPFTNNNYGDAYSITQGSNPLAGGTGSHSLDNYLGTDTTYQGQLSDLMRQYDQYNAQKGLTASQTTADYDAKQRALSDQATKDQLNIKNTAAAHGILNSGIYANELGQYNQQNQQQVTNLLGGLQNQQDNASMAYNQFIANEIAAKNSAMQSAAQRRAIQLGKF